LAMTGGQTGLFEDRMGQSKSDSASTRIRRLASDRKILKVIQPSDEELSMHKSWLDKRSNASGDQCIFNKLNS